MNVRRTRKKESLKIAATILSEGRSVVIIQEFRTVPERRLFCFAASRPVRTPNARPHRTALVLPAVRIEMCGEEVAR